VSIKKPWIVHLGDIRAAEVLVSEIEEKIRIAKLEKNQRRSIVDKSDNEIEEKILRGLEDDLEDLYRKNASAAYAMLEELKRKFPDHKWKS
jgi:hypothetical protein